MIDAAGIVSKNVSKTKPVALVSAGIIWPNEVEFIDSSVLGKPFLVVPGGFLLPWKSTGGIWLIDMSNFSPANPITPTPVKITDDKDGWFYHRARFYDVNGDGRQGTVFLHRLDSSCVLQSFQTSSPHVLRNPFSETAKVSLFGLSNPQEVRSREPGRRTSLPLVLTFSFNCLISTTTGFPRSLPRSILA